METGRERVSEQDEGKECCTVFGSPCNCGKRLDYGGLLDSAYTVVITRECAACVLLATDSQLN